MRYLEDGKSGDQVHYEAVTQLAREKPPAETRAFCGAERRSIKPHASKFEKCVAGHG